MNPITITIASMARAPFQVLIVPFRHSDEGLLFAVFNRRKAQYWQAVAGGGEDDETYEEAARREAWEETGLTGERRWISLDTVSSVRVTHFSDHIRWDPNLHVIPEYSFGVEVLPSEDIQLSDEHSEYRWLPMEEACALVRYDSNRTAIWELHRRLTRNPT